MASESVSLPTCAKCGIKAPKPSTKFCTKCGAKLEPTPVKLERPKCININCNKELEPDDEYCDECGTNQKHADQTSTSFKNNATGGNLNEVDPGNREPHKGDNEIDNSDSRMSLESSTISYPDESSIAVTFHVLVASKEWGWDPSKTVLKLCFGLKELGNWDGTTEFRLIRECQDGYLMMEGTINIPVSLIEGSNAVPYKYAVSNYQNPHVESYMEYLQNYPDIEKVDMLCRCLIIPVTAAHAQGNYHQYDTIVYPNQKSKNWSQRAIDWIKPDSSRNHDMRKACLLLYLDFIYDTLSRCNIIPDFSIKDICNSVVHIYTCLYSQRILKNKIASVWSDEELKSVLLQKWLISIVDHLSQIDIKTMDQNVYRVVSAVTVACIIQQFASLELINYSDFEPEKLANLLNLLHLFPLGQNKLCKDYEFLEKILPDDFRECVASAVCCLCKLAANTKSVDPVSWLCAMPLVHFLKKQCSPYGQMKTAVEEISFRDPNIQLQERNSNRRLKFVESSMNKVKPYFDLDPLLLPIYIWICPSNELEQLIDHIPLFMFALLIYRRFVEEVECINQHKALHIEILLVFIKSKLTVKTNASDFMHEAMLDSALYFLLKLKGKRFTNDAIQHCFKICGMLIFIILYCFDNHTIADEKLMELQLKLKQYTLEWVNRVCDDAQVAEHHRLDWCENRASFDLEVWESLCDIELQQLHQGWGRIVAEIVRDRIYKVYIAHLSDLLAFVGLRESTHEIVSDTVAYVVIERLEEMNEQAFSTAVSVLHKAGEKGESKGNRDYSCGIFDELLTKKYLRDNKDLTFDDILEWKLWPTFMKIYSDAQQGGSVVQQSASCIMFARVVTLLNDMKNKLLLGNVTVTEIKKLEKKKTQMNKVFSATPRNVGITIEMFNKRLDELDAYLSHLNGVHQFCSSFAMPVEGIEDLKKRLDLDVSKEEIKSLCVYSPEEKCYTYPCFQDLSSLSSVLPDFGLLIKNKLFSNIWKSSITVVIAEETKLSVSSICEIVWPRMIEKVGWLKIELCKQSLQLLFVDEFFGELRNQSDISGALEDIFKWHCKFTNVKDDTPCPNESIMAITNYWFLRDCQHAAEAILTLKQQLSHSGNYSKYEEIVYTTKSALDKQTLRDVKVPFEHSETFAELFCRSSKLEHLLVLVRCIDVIKWLRKETKDVTDLQSFVTLSLATRAGEGDLNNDRLSTLCIVGSGYQSLIYDTPKDVQFEELAKYYAVLWEAQKSNPRLPKLLNDCNSSLELYKSVKASQGGTGLTCYGQLQSIQQHGFYVVKLPSNPDSMDIVKLYIESGRKFMTLEELVELESKLILTQKKADECEELELFYDTLHTTQYIAELLLAMKNIGNIQYQTWCLTFPCKTNVVAELQKIAKDMESKLDGWKMEIEMCRQMFYNLNYYTTRQLLILRNDLGKMRYCGKCIISPQVITLLQCISSSVTSEVVMKAIHKHFSELKKTTAQNRYILDTVPIPLEEEIRNTTDYQDQYLTQKQKNIYDYLKTQLNYNDRLALAAVQHSPDDEYEAYNWCIAHELMQDEFPAIQHSSSNCSLSTDYDKNSNDKGAQSEESDMSLQLDEEKLTPIEQICRSGYSIEQAKKAVEIHGDNMAEIMQYLLNAELNANVCPIHESDEPDIGFAHMRCTELKCNNVSADDNTLSISELGSILNHISDHSQIERNFPTKQLKPGIPILLIVKPENVLKTVLSLYMEDYSKPLPTLEEVLVCNEDTSEEEVTLLWRRAVGDPGFKRIFCLVHAEKLAYKVCDEVLKTLDKHTQGKNGYRLVIVCSEESQERSHFVSKLHLYRQQYITVYSEPQYSDYLMQHFKQSNVAQLSASSVDCERSCVRVVISERPGMGKSLYIKRMANTLFGLHKDNHIIIPMHGPDVTPDKIVQFLCNASTTLNCAIIHFDIATKIIFKVDTLLFSLLILKGLCDSHGKMWRCHPNHLTIVEATLPLTMEAHSLESPTHSFLKILPTIRFLTPKEAVTQNCQEKQNIYLLDEKKIFSHGFQLVYHYLDRYSRHCDLDAYSFDKDDLERDQLKCLQLVLRYCGISDPSWSEVRHFVKFLQIQLSSCETSPFCSTLGLKGLKSFAVKFMIIMSRDFATPSLLSAVPNASSPIHDDLEKYQIRKCWEQQTHPYLFFNQDGASISYIGFNINSAGDLINPVSHKVMEAAVMSRQLVQDLQKNSFNLKDAVHDKFALLEKIATVFGLDWLRDPDDSYVLTVDNTIKILAIYMRFRCGIPVILIGETGCGKTRLIQYMCDIMLLGSSCNREGARNLFILKVHGGTTEQDIIAVVEEAETQAKLNSLSGLETVLFFDEANTTEAIGLIKEIMCDHRINGQPIAKSVKLIAACNPYRRHTDAMIRKLEEAGLGYYIRPTSAQEKLGNIPLRQLVYRVLELPPSVRSFVYDFGQINSDHESDYIIKLVHFHLSKFHLDQCVIERISEILLKSQQYMKDTKDECSFVSLRDVERTMIVFGFFLDHIQTFSDCASKSESNIAKEKLDDVTSSLILALSVCYHAKLKKRNDFEHKIVRYFQTPLSLTVKQFQSVILWYQEALLDAMVIGPNTCIAKNEALRENVFMMAVCIELRIPLFLIGKPGSSKSLAKAIIAASMQGSASKHPLLKCFKQVHMFSYQCSQLSTALSINEVFDTARCFQQKQNTAAFVSVVVLDEIGLAEDSPQLPLKALHPLLEDGTGTAKMMTLQENRVAFIGISNWALDPAKMNRGIMVTRGDPNIDELELSAKGICSNRDDDNVRDKLAVLYRPLAQAYKNLTSKTTNTKKDFYGLRDFYSLIKMLYWNIGKSKDQEITWLILLNAIKRNFGGLEGCDPVKIFRNSMNHLPHALKRDMEEHCSSSGDSELELIKCSLKSRDTSWHGENRYLLFITESSAALQIVQNQLLEFIELSHCNPDTQCCTMKPFVLFGSSFPKDKKYTQVCRNMNQIKLCMETGRAVILLNLEHLYESLYDVLNQHYTYHGDNRYVDLGLQTHRVKCRVHSEFKLILIAEKVAVYERFPTPLINRLEKHFVPISTIFESWQHEVVKRLVQWTDMFTAIDHSRNYTFSKKDAFIGYRDETPANIVYHATQQVKKWRETQMNDYNLSPSLQSQNCDLGAQNELWSLMVFNQSKWLLLQIASPSALIRLRKSDMPTEECQELNNIYFKEQFHFSLRQLLERHLLTPSESILLQVTTHSPLLTVNEVKELKQLLRLDVFCYALQEFDTEIDFCSRISTAFTKRDSRKEALLIIQCESGHLCNDLITCARYKVHDELDRVRRTSLDKDNITHVLFIINLPSNLNSLSTFVGFQCDQWISMHLDELWPDDLSNFDIHKISGYKICELFIGHNSLQHNADVIVLPQYQRLHSCIHAAVSQLSNSARAIERVRLLLDLIPKSPLPLSILDTASFYSILVHHIFERLKQNDTVDWMLEEALNIQRLQHGGTFRNALIRKIDEVVLPIFAEIIDWCDYKCNLDLIHQQSNPAIGKFWLSMFKSSHIGSLATHTKRQVVEAKHYKCKLPFSWVIVETMDSVWINVINETENENDMESLRKKALTFLEDTSVGEILQSVSDNDCDELFKCYLHDFVKSVHLSNHSDAFLSELEYKHITSALGKLCEIDTLSLTKKIASLQTVHWLHKAHILSYGQLSWQLPGILEPHIPLPESDEMVLHLNGALNGLAILKPPFDRSEPEIKQWLQRIQYSGNAIYSALSLPSTSNEQTQLVPARRLWQLILATKLFVEHILLNSDTKMMFTFFRRFYKVLESNPNMDFSRGKTIKDVQMVLKTVLKQSAALRENCNEFFVELVSTLCFCNWTKPDDELTEILIQTVFEAEYDDVQKNSCNIPVTKIALLQLLLGNRAEQVQAKLHSYLKTSKQQLTNVTGFNLFVIQCYEDVLHKEWSLGLQEAVFTQQMSDAYEYISQRTKCAGDANEYIEKIAFLRFALEKTADMMYCRLSSPTSQFTNTLLESIKTIHVATCFTSPALHLTKIIVRHYGVSSLKEMITMYPWAIPANIANEFEEEKEYLDPFLIHGTTYVGACEMIAEVLHRELSTGIPPIMDYMNNHAVVCVLAIYSNVCLPSHIRNQSQECITMMLDMVQKYLPSSNKLLSVAQLLLSNGQGELLPRLDVKCAQPNLSTTLARVVIHTVTVISAINPSSIMAPFFNMLMNPAALKDKYLPAMPDGTALEPYQALSGRFCYCLKGHLYLVAEQRHPPEQTCPTCGVPIEHHQAAHPQTNMIRRDSTTGHTLGNSKGRCSLPTGERGLTRASCCIIKALIHSVLLWASCNNTDAVSGLITPHIQDEKIPHFLLNHLENDVFHLAKAIGKGYDEAVIIVHLVLHDIFQNKASYAVDGRPQNTLTTKDERSAWEVEFQTTYIQPTLQETDVKILSVVQLNLNNKKHGYNHRLLSIAYESEETNECGIDHIHLAFRPKITIENLLQLVEAQNLCSSYPILYAFLDQEISLRATQYLPDIVHLQQYFHDRYASQVQYKKISGMTIGLLLKECGNHAKLKKMISSFSKAWKLVYDKLLVHAAARLQAKMEYFDPEITDNTSLECLIPTTTGPGVCTTALVDFLVCIHNNFIEHCRVQNSTAPRWSPQKIPISHLNTCHLVNCEHQILPIIISHCQYFKLNQGQEPKLNLAALEKCIVDQFVHGKPFIMLDVPLVVPKKELTSALRKKIAQEQLTSQHRASLCNELKTADKLKDTLDGITIILGFLSSMGGKGDTPIREYATKTLKMRPPAVSQSHKLKHIISIWQSLSVQLAITTNQDPFDHIEKEFKSDLTQLQKSELDKILRIFDIDDLLGILYEITESRLRFCSHEELILPLLNIIHGFREVCGFKPMHELNEFPNSITFQQIVATWKHVAFYKRKHEHENDGQDKHVQV